MRPPTMKYSQTTHAPTTILPPERILSAPDEANHRVANSLQLVSAMISAAIRQAMDPAAIETLVATMHRIDAIAGVHRHLYRSYASSELDLGEYLEELAGELERSYGDPKACRVIDVGVEAVTASPEIATSVGIIVSELVGNAFKYAYPDEMPGEVRLALRRLATGGFELIVEDDGAGFIEGEAPLGSGLGSRLIGIMVRRLGAFYDWQSSDEGTRFVMLIGSR